MLRISCCVCGSMFVVAELPADQPLCYRCGSVDAAVKTQKRTKRKPPKPPAVVTDTGTGRDVP